MNKSRNQGDADLVENLDQSRYWPMAVPIVTGLATLAGVALFLGGEISLLEVNDDLVGNGGDFFLKYFFLVVAIERAAAVFVEIFRKQSSINWTLRINRIAEVLNEDIPEAVMKQVYARERRIVADLVKTGHLHAIDEVPTSNPTKGDYLGFLTSAKHGYEFLRAQYNAAGSRYVARIVFIVAVIFSAFGLSILQDILGSFTIVGENEIGGLQQGLLRFADTLITGGLLGGGSAGLNGVANKLNQLLNRT